MRNPPWVSGLPETGVINAQVG
ncbi:MAG: hypothetical protein QOG74_929, partial [Alphaproteobacteria bacterium]|nr:hypothetical protein [Alphaproteobacteria bacterium]